MKRKPGQPTKYKEKYCQMIIDFFANHELTKERVKATNDDGYEITERVCNEYPTLTDFARKIRVSRSEINVWGRKHPEFLQSLKEAKELQQEIIIKSALMGLFNASFSIFAMKNIAGWRDKTEIEHGGNITLSIKELISNVEHRQREISAFTRN